MCVEVLHYNVINHWRWGQGCNGQVRLDALPDVGGRDVDRGVFDPIDPRAEIGQGAIERGPIGFITGSTQHR
jgi:hypothetical protein